MLSICNRLLKRSISLVSELLLKTPRENWMSLKIAKKGPPKILSSIRQTITLAKYGQNQLFQNSDNEPKNRSDPRAFFQGKWLHVRKNSELCGISICTVRIPAFFSLEQPASMGKNSILVATVGGGYSRGKKRLTSPSEPHSHGTIWPVCSLPRRPHSCGCLYLLWLRAHVVLTVLTLGVLEAFGEHLSYFRQ